MQMTTTSLIREERTEPIKVDLLERFLAGVVAAACLAVIGIASWLTPSSDGHGTHTDLGLSPCMWVVTLDKPCPTCGMTTSFTHAGEGQWINSFLTQPMGFLLVLMTATVGIGAFVQFATGAKIYAMIEPILKPKFIITLGVLLVAAWLYKVATWS